MKKILITMIATCVALGVASAQTAGPAGGAPPTPPVQGAAGGGHHVNIKKMEEALAKLNLTDAQKSQIKDLFGKAGVARKDLAQKVKSGQITKEQAKAQMQVNAKETRENLSKILSKQQMKELVAIMRADRKNKGAPGTPPTTSTPPTF